MSSIGKGFLVLLKSFVFIRKLSEAIQLKSLLFSFSTFAVESNLSILHSLQALQD